MSVPDASDGYGLGPDEGEAVWFNGGLGLLRATGDQTQGRYAVMELHHCISIEPRMSSSSCCRERSGSGTATA